MDIEAVLSRLTLDEKIEILTGRDNWSTVAVERAGLPSIRVSDGPHGLRVMRPGPDGKDIQSKAVCFPTLSAMGCTWDETLAEEMGRTIGMACAGEDVDILLGPGTNIKRTPLCGRNFEYFSEDPLLAGKLAAAYIRGVQSVGIGTSLKHFAANNQEIERGFISSEVDERTLREIYLKPFEIAVKEADPWTVMCAYNRVNGVWCSENRHLLDDILRREWNFGGIVVSDWGAVHDRVASLLASLELGMPNRAESGKELRAALQSGIITEAHIDKAVSGIVRLAAKIEANRSKRKHLDLEAQHAFAVKAARDSIVLLKNENSILPLDQTKADGRKRRIAILGQFAGDPVIQGGGSAKVLPTRTDGALESMKTLAAERGFETEYVHAYTTWTGTPGLERLGACKEAAYGSDLAVVFVGNYHGVEGESVDRDHMKLCRQMELLIAGVAEVQPSTIVVVQAGSAIDMGAWADKVGAIVYNGYAGQGGGQALAEILFGLQNPSGRLAETFPVCIEDTPAYPSYPGNGYVVPYREGVLVGYRHYLTKGIPVLFPFGHGLSYTAYTYSDLVLETSNDAIKISFALTNKGGRDGTETVQVYAGKTFSYVTRPVRELKAFRKVPVAANETVRVSLEIAWRDFGHFDPNTRTWILLDGEYRIFAGASSEDIRLEGKVTR